MSIIQTAERSSGEDASENVIFQRHMIAYKKAAELVKKNILEIGCGEGYGIKELLPKVEKYICIDKYESNINYKSEKLTFIKSEVPPLNKIKSDSLDFVVTFQVIEHIFDDKQFLSEIKRVLKIYIITQMEIGTIVHIFWFNLTNSKCFISSHNNA